MSHIDLEQGTHRRNGSDVSAGEASVCFSDGDEGSCYSQFYSTAGGSHDDYSLPDGEIGGASDCSVEAEIQRGVPEIKVHLAKVERDCRICHLGLESNSHESGVPIELGCSCKADLAAAHKHCAEAWFKIRGNNFNNCKQTRVPQLSQDQHTIRALEAFGTAIASSIFSSLAWYLHLSYHGSFTSTCHHHKIQLHVLSNKVERTRTCGNGITVNKPGETCCCGS